VTDPSGGETNQSVALVGWPHEALVDVPFRTAITAAWVQRPYQYREPRLNFQSSQQQSVGSLIMVVIIVGGL
jgi:hypothetical protein